jgi:hypothetical protein
VQDNLTVSKNQNASTSLEVINTTSGTGALTRLVVTSTLGSLAFGKFSTATTVYKNVSGNDGYIYLNGTGNISILNDFGTGNINFAAGGSSTAQATLFSTGNLALNTTTDAGFRLDVNGTARVQGAFTLNVSGQSTLFSNNYAGASAAGQNIFIGGGGINATTGGTGAFKGSYNTSLGNNSLLNITQGYLNTAIGINTLSAITTDNDNTAIGASSLNVLTGGQFNNTAVGSTSLSNLTTGSNNIAIGWKAGFTITGGSTANAISNSSIFIGSDTKALASNQTNQIVIGHNTVGLGSNTTILGNSSTVTTAIYGDILIGTTTALASTKLTVSGSETASSAIARGGLINTTLVAAANNDVLVGLDINPTFTNGAFTGVSNLGLRVNNGTTILNSGATFNTLSTSSNFFVENTDNIYRYANLINWNGYNVGGRTNVTADVFSVGANSGVSNNGNSFFRLNFNGGNSTGIYGASGNNNTIAHLNATSNATFYITAQGAGGFLNASSSGLLVSTTIDGLDLSLRSEKGSGNAGGGINYLSSINGSRHSHRFFHNNVEQMRLQYTGNLLIGTTTDAGFRLDVNGTARVQGDTSVSGSVTATGNSNSAIIHSVGDSYNVRLNADRINFLGTGNSFSGLVIGNTFGFIGVNKSTFNSIPTGSILIGSNANGNVSFIDNQYNETFSVINSGSTNSFCRINGGYRYGTDLNASNFNIITPLGTGTGTGGDIITSIGVAGTTGTTRNTTAEIMRVKSSTANISIGANATPNASAILDITSTTKGFLPPRMTTTQKNAISTPATGLVVYDTTLNKLSVYTGSAWETVTSL